jgi:hypothetical protein
VLAASGCGLPTRAIPTERALFGGRSVVFGTAAVAPDGAREDVVELRRAGPAEDVSILVRLRGGSIATEVLEAGSVVPRPASPSELEEAALVLGPDNPAYAREGLRAWLAERTDVAALERGLREEARARRGAQDGFLGGLIAAARRERTALEAEEADERRRSNVFAGLFGWQRGRYSGFSWSLLHLERFDRLEDEREVVLFPLLTSVRATHDGGAAFLGPLLSYGVDVETPLERTSGLYVLGCGARTRVSAAGEETLVLALPLLFGRSVETGEDVAARGGRVRAGRRESTHLLASLVAWSSETPGVYRDGTALRNVGRDAFSVRVLPLFSHCRDGRSSETMLWPLLGFGWGSDDGEGYVRLLYFVKIGGR